MLMRSLQGSGEGIGGRRLHALLCIAISASSHYTWSLLSDRGWRKEGGVERWITPDTLPPPPPPPQVTGCC